MAGKPLPDSLAAEGSMMLQALLGELKLLPQIELLVAVDERCLHLPELANVETVVINAQQNVLDVLPQLIALCDAVWPIAPETDGVLATIARLVTAQQKILLASCVEAILVCGDKLATYDLLHALYLPVVATQLLKDFMPAAGRYVIKPRDGVGCLGGVIIDDGRCLPERLLNTAAPELYLIQPYHQGLAISLSCLFKQGRGWLICCNRQQIAIVDHGFQLTGCVVNTGNENFGFYQQLVSNIAAAIPGLWGYVGIDLLETPDNGPLILEINPRLTTSYVGIMVATGVNVAGQVLALVDAEPEEWLVREVGFEIEVVV